VWQVETGQQTFSPNLFLASRLGPGAHPRARPRPRGGWLESPSPMNPRRNAALCTLILLQDRSRNEYHEAFVAKKYIHNKTCGKQKLVRRRSTSRFSKGNLPRRCRGKSCGAMMMWSKTGAKTDNDDTSHSCRFCLFAKVSLHLCQKQKPRAPRQDEMLRTRVA
jgi:hypothetical protein